MAEREKIEFDYNFDWALKKSDSVNKRLLCFQEKVGEKDEIITNEETRKASDAMQIDQPIQSNKATNNDNTTSDLLNMNNVVNIGSSNNLMKDKRNTKKSN